MATELTASVEDSSSDVSVNMSRQLGASWGGPMLRQLHALPVPCPTTRAHSTFSSLWSLIRSKAKQEATVDAPVPGPAPATLSPWLEPARAPLAPLQAFWLRSALFRCSAQKLNLLGRQIHGLPLQHALNQMRFSPKKPAQNIYQLLWQGRARILQEDAAQGTAPAAPSPSAALPSAVPPLLNRWIVKQVTVGKGPYLKRIDIKARGRHGIIWRPHSFFRILLAIPDRDVELQRKFKVRIPKEDRPAYIRLNY